MFKATVNNQSQFEIATSEKGFVVNGKTVSWDIATLADGYFHILFNGKSYKAEIVKADKESKTISVKINSQLYSVALKDRFDLLLEKMGMSGAAASKINSVKAPMPGLIIDLKVKAGDAVKAGDPLLILEAMKMENILKSPGDAVVKSVKTKKGDSVEKGQVLIEF